jgi:hypothetical protein
MTKKKPGASQGRPPKDEDDLIVRELALAYRVAWGLGPQMARDLALAVLEGRACWPTKLPRGSRKTAVGSKLTGAWLPHATFKGREGAIAKSRRGDWVRPDVVIAWAGVLRAEDEKQLIGCLKALVDALSAR